MKRIFWKIEKENIVPDAEMLSILKLKNVVVVESNTLEEFHGK